MKLKDLVKNRRDRVEFGCTVSDPDAPVIWFKGERELRPAAEYDFLSKGEINSEVTNYKPFFQEETENWSSRTRLLTMREDTLVKWEKKRLQRL